MGLSDMVFAPTNHHNIERVDKDAKVKESICVISMLENIPQPCKGFGTDTVSCKCLFWVHDTHMDDIQL